MKESVRALLIFLVFSVAAGIAYPLGITGLARLFFKEKATGSLVTDQGRAVGSALIGQKFTGARYFHGRPSANDYDAANSGGDNFGPANRKYLEEVAGRVKKTRSENGLGPDAPVPADLVLASASGLDPHISPEAASSRRLGLPLPAALSRRPSKVLSYLRPRGATRGNSRGSMCSG